LLPSRAVSSACAACDFVTEIAEDVDLLDFAGWQNSAKMERSIAY
jgi:hypothetical protein